MRNNIIVDFRTWTQSFHDWYDFADFLKQRQLKNLSTEIIGWRYVQDLRDCIAAVINDHATANNEGFVTNADHVAERILKICLVKEERSRITTEQLDELQFGKHLHQRPKED